MLPITTGHSTPNRSLFSLHVSDFFLTWTCSLRGIREGLRHHFIDFESVLKNTGPWIGRFLLIFVKMGCTYEFLTRKLFVGFSWFLRNFNVEGSTFLNNFFPDRKINFASLKIIYKFLICKYSLKFFLQNKPIPRVVRLLLTSQWGGKYGGSRRIR